MEHGQRAEPRGAHRGECGLKHVVRIGRNDLTIHGVADAGVHSPLGEGAQQGFPRQHAEHVVAEDDGKILLPTGQHVVNGGGKRIIRLQGPEIREHGLLHGDAPQRTVYLHQGGFLLGSIQTKSAMKIRKGSVNRPMSPKKNAMACPTRAAISVARVYSKRVPRIARSTRPPSMGKAGIRLNASSQKFTTISLFRKLPPAQRKVPSNSGWRPASHPKRKSLRQ